ncbi:unnamed protein product [Eruca vesicaria subsp. sativa]|uniref:Uncharacterized protein n=1 Tax=Eruca vesicaria subsp. sativa TaxID=29727 RepID=A0ABC8IZX9_ERUVS|nr:unnamed protein product [Eruca vesicaria subsp. sativa]
MDPESSQRQCASCEELEPQFNLTVIKENVLRPLCTDCLLKEQRKLFCPICLELYAGPPPLEATRICILCPSIAHLHCSPPSPSSSRSSFSYHFFTCPLCVNPNFSFLPKSLATTSDQSGDNDDDDDDDDDDDVDLQKAKALVAAAEIVVACTENAAAQLKEEAANKSIEAEEAKKKAKEALEYLENVKEKAEEKRKAKKPKLQ